MFRPASLYIALRYISAKKRNHFISFMALMSMIGMALSLMVLITVLSVFNGFDQQISQRIFTMAPHIIVTGDNNKLYHWQALQHKVLQQPGVLAAAPFVVGQGLLVKNAAVHPIVVTGILPKHQQHISFLDKKITEGAFNTLQPQQFAMVVGSSLASSLQIGLGDTVNLFVPKVSITPVGIIPRVRHFTIKGIFDTGGGSGLGFNSSYAFISLADAKAMFGFNHYVNGLQLRVHDLFAAPSIAKQLQQTLGYHYQVSNWTEQYGAFYHAVKMEKSMMFLILMLLVLIAVFNLVAGLVMTVVDKTTDIAILRTLGATSLLIMRIFIIQGAMIGLVGSVLGLMGGLLLATHVTAVVNFLEHTFHLELFTSNVYFINYLPSQVEISDVVKVCTLSLSLSILATIYPAWRAASIKPAQVLRHQ